MKLHDPLVESEIIRIARNLAGSRGFEKIDHGFWRSLPRRLAICLGLLFIAAIVIVPAWKPERPEVMRQTVGAISMMFLIRLGLAQIAMTFTGTGFFSTLVNLPVSGRTALLHIRGLVFRSFLPLAVAGSLAAATLLHIHAPEPMTWTAILRTAALLSAVLWATLGIVQIRWIKRLRFDLLWQWSAYGLVAFLVLLHFTGEAYVIPEAIRPFPVGNDPVPRFATLPVSLRTLLRITFRITIVRTCLAVLIGTPFYWSLAKIYGMPEIATALVVMIPAIGAAWILSTPALLANRLEPHTIRRRGILILTIANSLAMIPIGLLWVCCSLAGIGMAFAWAAGAAEGRFAFLLLPAALASLAFAAFMSRLLFEALHLFIRQRSYDWKSKIR